MHFLDRSRLVFSNTCGSIEIHDRTVSSPDARDLTIDNLQRISGFTVEPDELKLVRLHRNDFGEFSAEAKTAANSQN